MGKTSHDEILIAALLHDLGKAAQRAGAEECLTPGMEGQLLPRTPDGRYTHKHAWYTHGAILALRDCLPKGIDYERVARIAACHHNPSTWEEWIVAESDRISSGADRSPRELESEERGNYIEQQCLSVFSSVRLGEALRPPEVFLRLGPLEQGQVYPKPSAKSDRQGYRRIWDGLVSDLRAIRDTTLNAWLVSADAALERWTWSIPSTTVDQPDISLYDHARTCAAYASALYRYHEGENSLEDIPGIQDTATPKFLIVTGDLSGIQKYLFDIRSAEHSAKLLRARSFELRMLSESAARMIQKQFGLSRFSQIGNAGGRFTIVLPNLEKTPGILEKVRGELESVMIRRYLGSVSLSISAGVPASKDTLLQDRFREAFRRMLMDAAEAKHKKLQAGLLRTGHVLAEGYDAIEAGHKSGLGICPMCEARPGEGESGPCSVCSSLIESGSRLPKAERINLAPARGVNRGLELLADETAILLQPGEEPVPGGITTTVHVFKPGYGLSRMPYSVPVKDGRVMEFGDIAKTSEGIPHLAMLKADLDSLGAVFSAGLGDSLSVSRYATLSRTIDYFFTVEVREILGRDPRFQHVYTVYSGGDDLCLIGPWNVMFDLAVVLRNAFGEFTGGNPSLSISSGIAIASSRLPIRRIADEAESELENAKDRPGKNSVSVFGIALGWNEFEAYLEDGKLLSDELRSRACPTAAVYALIENSRKAEAFLKGDISRENSLWKSHFEYALRRTNASKASVEVMRKYSVDATSIHKARISASYALYSNRVQGGR